MNDDTIPDTALDADPEFADRLEWQLRTALQRRSRFARPAARGPAHLARLAALVLGGILCGAATVVAAERLQERPQRDFHVASTRIRAQLAANAAELARTATERERMYFEQGLSGGGELIDLERRLREAETRAEVTKLDALEAQETGAAPRHDLAAPRVAGRDLVSERLQFEREGEQASLKIVRAALERATLLHESGFIASGEIGERRRDVALRESRIANLDGRLELRRRFLAAELDEREVLGEDLLADARLRGARAAATAANLSERIGLIQARVAAGVESSRGLAALEFELRTAEAERQLADMEVELLEGQRADPRDR